MRVEIKAGTAQGTAQAPPSKSDAHRALIAAALAEGKSIIRGIAPSEDILATLDCIRALGAKVEIAGNVATVTGGALEVQNVFPCRESGSTLRFLLPLALLRNTPCVFFGSQRLLERPMEIYESICCAQGINFTRQNGKIEVCGRLASGDYFLRGDLSSQFITGLLFALPLLQGESRLGVEPPFVSRPYVEMTLDTLEKFGIRIAQVDPLTFAIPGNQKYCPIDYSVEGDWSNAAFYEALHLLGGNVLITGLQPDSKQGDRVYRTLFPQIESGCPTIDIADCPDLAPILMAMGAAFHGIVLKNTARLKIKESDRGVAMAEELAKFGVACRVDGNSITVCGGELKKPRQPICGHNDHRIVMACATLLTRTGGAIEGAETVDKSNPTYFYDLQKLGIGVEIYGTVNR
ncbi:MAG: 3-phosphoshikimate 1-carboxyvinyltransferase [Ruminococcaceae bacterium]|nr:3-phosphoshikimate 1-carboxyvinyltransferase [Oscillospiraceae bacterium]